MNVLSHRMTFLTVTSLQGGERRIRPLGKPIHCFPGTGKENLEIKYAKSSSPKVGLIGCCPLTKRSHLRMTNDRRIIHIADQPDESKEGSDEY